MGKQRKKSRTSKRRHFLKNRERMMDSIRMRTLGNKSISNASETEIPGSSVNDIEACKGTFLKNDLFDVDIDVNDVEACQGASPKKELFDVDIDVNDVEACQGTSPEKDLFDADIDVNDVEACQGMSPDKDLFDADIDVNDVEACQGTSPEKDLFDADIDVNDVEACQGTSPEKDLFDADIHVNDRISRKRDLPKSKPGPASSKKKRRNAFVDTDDDTDTASEEETQHTWTPPPCTSIPAVQDEFSTILPVEEVNIPEEKPSIMVFNSQTGNVERIDHTYSQKVLPVTYSRRASEIGIRLKNSRDLLQPPYMKQMRDRLNEISSEFHVKGPLLDTSHFRVVMEKITNTLDNMSRDEVISFCKIKIEEEVAWKAEKIEREKQIDHLEASLFACKAELTALKNKNAELKNAVATIYGEYKRETSNKVSPPPPSLLKKSVRRVTKKPPIVPVQLKKRPFSFILPHILPEDNSEFITDDVNKTKGNEYPEVPILPLNSETVPETISTIKQEQITCAQNGVPPPNPTHYLVISPSNSSDLPPPPTTMRSNNQYQHKQQSVITSTANTTTHCLNQPNPVERSQIQNDSLDIEDRIPHALITCKSVQNIPPISMSTSSKAKTKSTNNVEVFKVLQSIDLTHEQKISKQKATQKTTSNDLITSSNDLISTSNDLITTSNDLITIDNDLMNPGNCFPRIVSTQSLAPPKVEPAKALDNNLTASLPLLNNPEISMVQNSSQLLIPGSFSSNLLNSNGQTILNGANPMQIAYIVNGAPGSQGPQQMYFTLQPQTLQGNTMMYPQQNNTYFCQTTSSVTSEIGPMMIPHISGVSSLGKSVHGAIKHSTSTGTQVMQEVFDLTSDVPNSNMQFGNTPLLTYDNVGKVGTNDWNENLDNKLLEVKQRIYSKKFNQKLDKVALVKISRQDKKAADSKIRPYVIKKLSKFSGSVPGSLIKKFT